MTLKEYLIGQALAGTDTNFPSTPSGEELLPDAWAENAAMRIVELVNNVLILARLDGKKEITL